MPQRLFEDLVASRLVRSRRDRARALPFSLVFHGLALGAAILLPQLATDLPPVAAAPPPIPYFPLVHVADVAPPPTPPRPTAVRHPPSTAAEPPAPVAGTGPALPSDLSTLGEGPILDDSPALCLSGCTGEGTPGAILPGAPEPGGDGGAATVVRRAGRDVTPPAKLSGSPPAYPDLAKRAHVEGDVVIECTIDPAGRVANAVVTKSIPLLDEAALDAVRGWRYRPTLLNGVPVPVLMTVTVRFRIH